MRRRTLLLVVFSFSVFLLAVIAGIASLTKTPTIPLVASVFSPVQYSLMRIFHQHTPVTEVDRLKQQNNDLQKQLARLHLLQADNKALRDQFQTTTLPASNLLPVPVIGMPGFLPGVTVPDTLIIGAGAKEGVRKGQAVVYKDELLGTVIAVSNHVAKVQLISATGVSFAAKTAKTGALGIVKGYGDGQVELDNVELSNTLSIGDMVVSGADAGDSGNGIPPGLIIGKITSVDKKSSNLFQKANIEMLTDITRLPEVFLLVTQ